MLVGLVVNAVEIRASNDLAGVQESDALALCDFTVTLAEENGLFSAALEHFRVVGELGDRRGRDQEDLRRAAVWPLPVGAGQER